MEVGDSVNRASLVIAWSESDSLDRHLEAAQSRFNCLTDAAVAHEQHRVVGQTLVPGRRPVPFVARSHEVRDPALGGEDEREDEFRGGRLVDRFGVGEDEPRGQHVLDAVVADHLALYESGVHVVQGLQ